MLVKSKIKYIQSLGQKKFRDETGVFIAEGPKIVKELLNAGPALVQEVYALPEWITENQHLLKHTLTEEITGAELQKISQLKTPNKVLALAGQFTHEQMEVKGRLTLALCGIQDPGNLGTIIRIADWFGITQVVCSEDSADLYNPKVIQSTMGSIARVRVYYSNLADLIGDPAGVPVYATVLDGQDVSKIEKPGQGILLIGNESKGIPPELLQRASVRITIPKKGGAESLNAAVAAGIILSHLT
ncbi:MAG: RNA methyltransferase [Sphingobacteriales bacterium]|nr:RNA methyltransferase [Sphingobacteriales bacterium]